MNQSNPVRIRIEVEVPVGIPCSVEVPSPKPPESSPRPVQIAGPGSITVLQAIGITPPQLMKVDGSGSPNGAICVHADIQKNDSDQFASNAWITVNQTGPIATFAQGQQGQQFSPSQTDTFNEFLFVSGGKCGTGFSNYLTIWVQYPDGEVCRSHLDNFPLICSDHTDCDRGITKVPTKQSATSVAQWRVLAQGFDGECRQFNQDYLLRQVSACPENWKWSNGGCGCTTPRIELTVPRTESNRCTLVLILGGKRICYSVPVTNWKAAGRNLMNSLRTEGVSLNVTLPESIEVFPCDAVQ